jgi:hypothetical protein
MVMIDCRNIVIFVAVVLQMSVRTSRRVSGNRKPRKSWTTGTNTMPNSWRKPRITTGTSTLP